MVQVTFNTDSIVHGIIKILAIIGLIAVVIFSWGCVTDKDTVVSTPTITIPTMATISYPSVLTFTVLSTTTSTGRYQVTTTSGNILYFMDYQTWDMMHPQNTYTATLTGTDGVGYIVGTVNLIHSVDYYNGYNNYQEYYSQSLPTYWHYGERYYQCDGTVCDPMTYKQISGEYVHEGRPPVPLRFGYKYY